ncbi:MAG: hypothetical protein ACYCTE_07180, partial [Acidimicrobiales bacterium]
AQVAGAFAAPMQWFAALLAAVPQKMAYALSALIEARGGAEGTAAVTEGTAAVAEDTAAVAEDTGGTA